MILNFTLMIPYRVASVNISPNSHPDRALSTLHYGPASSCNTPRSCYGHPPTACSYTTRYITSPLRHQIQLSTCDYETHSHRWVNTQECSITYHPLLSLISASARKDHLLANSSLQSFLSTYTLKYRSMKIIRLS
jgi:hypothetical protein